MVQLPQSQEDTIKVRVVENLVATPSQARAVFINDSCVRARTVKLVQKSATLYCSVVTFGDSSRLI